MIDLHGIPLNVEAHSSGSGSSDYIFFLHGFTGSSGDWKNIITSIDSRFNIAAVDLIGHGKSSSPENISLYSAGSIVEQIGMIVKHFTEEKIFLAGYSMGGRASLSFAVNHPEMLRGLILESTSAGIKKEKQRTERVKLDNELADFVESHSIEEFVEYWMNVDLFASQKNLPKEKLDEVRKLKLRNSKTGLANSLRGFGTGKMPFLLDQIKKIKCKTLLITGELDSKFTSINSEMVDVFPDAKHIVIKKAGHNTHLEKPAEFAGVINTFLREF